MKPIEFKEQTTVITKDQTEYVSLPAFVDPSPKGQVVFCMKLSLFERIKLLLTGKLWCVLLMFRDDKGKLNPVTPSFFTVNKSDIFE